MKLVSIETIPGQEFEALDIVRGTVAVSYTHLRAHET